jgi:hypothetical protein
VNIAGDAFGRSSGAFAVRDQRHATRNHRCVRVRVRVLIVEDDVGTASLDACIAADGGGPHHALKYSGPFRKRKKSHAKPLGYLALLQPIAGGTWARKISDHCGREATAVIVIVIVIVSVIVAALVNGNDVVIVIDAVDDQGSINFVSMATMRSSSSIPRA